MKQKKVIALLAVAAMTVGLFSGCGSGSGDEKKSGGNRRGILGRKNGSIRKRE